MLGIRHLFDGDTIFHSKIHFSFLRLLLKTETEPCIDGKSYCEVDESEVINYNNETIWMFGIYDRGINEAKIF